ncbi:MAG TPA: DUF1707 domain-containing protein [Solirubrobacteraceae bacterium]|jgi:hypothetical protein|nr:DUF1707 domain-containing protein [Solirubrobacteraceae bacterium]
MTRRAILRASDADREQVAERLRQAAAEGRLFADELEERLGAALSAKTYGELDEVVSDLPDPGPSHPRRSGELVRARPAVALAVALPLAMMLIGIIAFALAGHDHPGHGGGGLASGAPLIWLVWIALGWRYLSRRRNRMR